MAKTWAEEQIEYLEKKDKRYWSEDDYEKYCYCMECIAEDERDAEYLGCYEVIS